MCSGSSSPDLTNIFVVPTLMIFRSFLLSRVAWEHTAVRFYIGNCLYSTCTGGTPDSVSGMSHGKNTLLQLALLRFSTSFFLETFPSSLSLSSYLQLVGKVYVLPFLGVTLPIYPLSDAGTALLDQAMAFSRQSTPLSFRCYSSSQLPIYRFSGQERWLKTQSEKTLKASS